MTKCGKGCMPECEYFTTGGCISPFNCQYKIETGYINSATSIATYIPTYMEKQMSMTAEEIEHCLERFTMGKTTDVMNFDYAGILAYIRRIKSENERLEAENKRMLNQIAHMVTPPCDLGDVLYMPHIVFQDGYDDYGNATHNITGEVEKIIVDRQNFYQVCYWIERNRAFFSEEEAKKNLQHKFDGLKE